MQALCDPDVVRRHAAASGGEDGLAILLEVFEQVFRDHLGDAEFGARVRDVDGTPGAWAAVTMTGARSRQVGVPRQYQVAVGEARMLAIGEGRQGDRPEFVGHWCDAGTRRVPPVLIAGSVRGRDDGDEPLVGFARLGTCSGCSIGATFRASQGIASGPGVEWLGNCLEKLIAGIRMPTLSVGDDATSASRGCRPRRG